jgi:glycosyltransferase involved in cell wall biosynthesis
MKAPLLSICIATYNRGGFIGETLNSIIPQLTDDVELLIVDGASTDDTEQVMYSYLKWCNRIRYVRLPMKGGVDQDYDKSVELAQGEFCWLFTDDDLLKPGAVATVKSAISAGYGLIIVNAEVRCYEFSSVLQRQRISMKEDKIYASNELENLFIDAMEYLSFIGAVVIRRSTWLNRERKLYYGTEFIHVGVLFQCPLAESAIIISEPYISIRYGNAQWTKRGIDIWLFKWPALIWSFKDISDSAKKSITQREPWKNIKYLLAYRSEGVYDFQSYNQYFSEKKVSVFWKFSAWLIACFPKNVIIGFRYIYSRRRPVSRDFFDHNFRQKKR